jgi:membrane-associated phospholipid phosphatase
MVLYLLTPYILWDLTRRRFYLLAASIAGVGLSVLVGRSRVSLRAHHRSDVIAGYGLGTVWLALTWRLFARRR